MQSKIALRTKRRYAMLQMRTVQSSPTVANMSESVGWVANPHSSPVKCDSWKMMGKNEMVCGLFAAQRGGRRGGSQRTMTKVMLPLCSAMS